MHSLVSPCRAASSRSRSTRQRNQKQKARPFTYHFLAHRILLSVSLSLQKTSSRFPSKKKKTSSDIVSGTFKGFALLRQQALASRADGRPAYLAGYGLVPPAQVRGASVSAFFR
jgi:hypothetical protein